jgi:hypothetical protein
MPLDKKDLWAKFEADGEAKVHENLAMGRYGEQKAKFANAWLREKESERAKQVEQRKEKTTTSSNRAAWMVAIGTIGLLLVAALALLKP